MFRFLMVYLFDVSSGFTSCEESKRNQKKSLKSVSFERISYLRVQVVGVMHMKFIRRVLNMYETGITCREKLRHALSSLTKIHGLEPARKIFSQIIRRCHRRRRS
jgi:hypothetical protein